LSKVLLEFRAKFCYVLDMSTSQPLDLEVRELLGARKGEWQSIASQSGISYSWLSKFFNGHIDNPGYQTLRSLHAVLAMPQTEAAPATAGA
jgi:transcriptional regulator with XRE-family HTH domain